MIQLSAGIKSFIVSFSPSREPDVTGYTVHAAHADDVVAGEFTPTTSTQINVGPETALTHKVTKSGTYYVKAAAYDSFEDPKNINYGSLNWTPTYTVEVMSLDPLDLTAPDVPTGLVLTTGLDTTQAIQDSAFIQATWTKPADPTTDLAGYSVRVQRSGQSTYSEVTVTGTNTTSVKIPGLLANFSYSVQVAAFDKWSNLSAYSAAASITTLKDLTIPADVVLSSVTSSFKSVFASWATVADADVKHYEVQVAKDSGFTIDLRTFTVNAISTTVSADLGSTYYVRVKAVDYSGNKSANFSNVLSTTPGSVPVTEVTSFYDEAAKAFKNTPVLKGYSFTNNSPLAGHIAWNSHTIYYNDAKVTIQAGSTNLMYVYWTGGTSYSTSDTYPTLTDGQFIIAVNDKLSGVATGVATLAWQSFANVVLGSANILNASIGSAKISSLVADKITTGTLDCGPLTITNLAFSDVGGSLSWSRVSDAPSFLLSSSPKLTYLDAAGLYTGTVNVANLNAGVYTGSGIGVGNNNVSIDGVNSRIKVHDGVRDRVIIGKTGVDTYGIHIFNSSGQALLTADGNLDGARVNNLVVNGAAVVGGSVTIGAAAITYSGGATVDSLKPAAAGADVTSTVLSTGTLSVGAALQIQNYLDITGSAATLRIGRSSFDTAVVTPGLVLGMEASVPKALFYKDVNSYFKYDSTGVVVKGEINATSGSFSGNITSSATITGGVLQTAGSGKRFVVSNSDNEAHFWGDRGDGTVEELCTIGISLEGSDYIVGRFGSVNSNFMAVAGYTNNGVALHGSAVGGWGVYGYSSSSVAVRGKSATGISGHFLPNTTRGAINLANGVTVHPSSPVEGDVYFNSGTKHFYGWDGAVWKQLS